MKHVDRFFAYARERHSMYLRRMAGEPEPWTKDKILYKYRFTNVFRELDKTTAWFRKYVRDPLRDKPEVLLATVAFRLLNRIETGEAVFCQTVLPLGQNKSVSAFEQFLGDSDVRHLKRAIVQYVGKRGPYVTGAYIISSPSGYSKLDGMLRVIGDFAKKSGWRAYAEMLRNISGQATLQGTHEWLRDQPFLGNFHSYEIVTDLRWTVLLDRAPDINTWANMGPGAKRGLNRIHDRPVRGDQSKHKWSASIETEQALREMQIILASSQDKKYWPQWNDHLGRYEVAGPIGKDMSLMQSPPGTPDKWPAWELREVEHSLCEMDKYERVRLGEGKPRGVYR